MTNLVLQHLVPKSSEGSYYTVDFAVPAGVDSLHISYDYERTSPNQERNIVDIGLLDQDGAFLGWSGSSRREIFVGSVESTNGYLTRDIHEGTWQIIVGAYHIQEGGLHVRYEITFYGKQSQWFVGDLHMHSDASDGQHEVYELTRKARTLGLDYIAVTNHNNTAENFHLPKVPGLTLIPAVEWTHYKGHMNFFGVQNPFENSFLANTEEEMLTLLGAAIAKGALISVNHPKDEGVPWLWGRDDCFDMVEVWNSVMRPANLNAIAWWHSLLLQGRRIPLVAGSDYHKDFHVSRFAHPVTWIYAESRSPEDLVQALRAGHSFAAAKAQGIRLELRADEAMMGDEVPWHEGLKLRYEVVGGGFGQRNYLVTQDEEILLPAAAGELAVLPSWQFAYLKVTRRIGKLNLVRAISNPLYFRVELEET